MAKDRRQVDGEGGVSIRKVPIATVLDWAEARWKPKLTTSDPGTHTTARTTLTLIDTLRFHWVGKKVGEIKQTKGETGTVNLYIKHRTAENVASNRRGPDGTVKNVSEATAWSEVLRLMAEVREYAAEHGMWDVPEVSVPTRDPRTVEFIGRDEVARLLWTVRGRVWEPKKETWKVDEDDRRILSRKRDIGWVARLILILVYTGSTANCATRLAWKPSEDGERSHFDLDTMIEGRRGHLLRLGPDLASKRMAGVPVAIPRRLAAHLRRWRTLDGGRHERVLHLTGKRGSRQGSTGTISIGRATLERVCERAGLAGVVDLPTLSDTAAVWALRAGSRKIRVRRRDKNGRKEGWTVLKYKPNPAIARSVSLMIGVDTRSLRKRFEHVMPDFQKKAMKALKDPAATVR